MALMQMLDRSLLWADHLRRQIIVYRPIEALIHQSPETAGGGGVSDVEAH